MNEIRKIKQEICNRHFIKMAVIVFLIGMITSFPYLADTIWNHDALANAYTDFDWLLEQGKWFVTPIAALKGAYDLPYLGNILGIVFLTVAVVLITRMLDVKEQWRQYVIAVLFVTFPSIGAFMIYHCADYFGFSILLAVAAAYFAEKKGILCYIISVICLTFSMGAYQAYIGMAASLMLIILMQELSQDKAENKDIILRGFRFLSILLISCILYYVILQTRLRMTGTVLSGYKNVSDMDAILNPAVLLASVKGAYKDTWKFFLKDILSGNSGVLRIAYRGTVICYLSVIGITMWKKIREKKVLQSILALIISIVLLPLALNAIGVLSNNATFYYISVYSLVLFPVAAFVYAGNHLEKCDFLRKIILGITTICVLLCSGQWIINNNTAHQKLVYCNQQIESKAQILVTQIQSCPGYTEGMKVVLAGEPPYSYFSPEGVAMDMENYLTNTMGTRNAMDLLYGADRLQNYLVNYISPHMQFVKKEGLSQEINDVIWNMPVYPTDGSIQIVEDTVCVKLGYSY